MNMGLSDNGCGAAIKPWEDNGYDFLSYAVDPDLPEIKLYNQVITIGSVMIGLARFDVSVSFCSSIAARKFRENILVICGDPMFNQFLAFYILPDNTVKHLFLPAPKGVTDYGIGIHFAGEYAVFRGIEDDYVCEYYVPLNTIFYYLNENKQVK